MWVSLTMVLCIIVGCGNNSGKSSQKKDSAVKFSRLPKIVRRRNDGAVDDQKKTCMDFCHKSQ